MKPQYLLLLFTLFGLQSLAQFNAQWQWLNPKPSGFSNVKVCFSGPDHGFIFNDHGDLIHTTDGGLHWAIQQNFPNAKVMDLRDSTGLIGGFSNAIFVSTDNGKNWQRKVISATQNPYFSFVQVISRDTLLALNSNDYTLFRSTDRGLTWTAVATNILLNNIRSFHFVNSGTGFISGYSGLYKTTDGGLTWQNILTFTSWPIIAIRFYDEKTGYAYKEDGQMLKTIDGGKTWTATTPLVFDVYSIFFADANTIYASGEQAKIYKSSDGGATWKIISPVVPNAGYGFNDVCFVNVTTGFVVGTSGKILATTDGGNTWQDYSPTYTSITSFQFPAAKVAYATDWWSVYRSTDGGLNWQPANLTLANTNSRISHCRFRNKDTGFVISQNPVMFYRTSDGGQNWAMHNPLPWGYDRAVCMSFANDTTGYLCMDNYSVYQIYKTTNGGETWTPVAITYNRFSKMDFVTEKTGYAVTGDKVFKTTDSAKTWVVIDDQNNTSNRFNGICFINETVGYGYGYNGFMQKTSDGGATWSKLGVPYSHIGNAHFFNEQVGYISNETLNYGILKTYDGGKTWHHQLPVPAFHMSSTSDSVMYIAGYGGAILAQTVQDYNLDSLQIKNITPCGARFSAYASVAFGNLDSLQLEYGIGAFTNSSLFSPASVVNGTIQATQSLENLMQNTSYVFRLKGFYKGQNIYSATDSFKTKAIQKPVIRVADDTILIASPNINNQWFFNGQPIPGAGNPILYPQESGNYAVQISELGCVSELSDAVQYVKPVFNDEISIAPNPVIDNIIIQNERSRSLIITIKDLAGHIIYTGRSDDEVVRISMVKYRNGLYVITVTDRKTKESVTKKILKM